MRELILELAVRGKLIPQDPNDEPASILLEKIATEKKRLFKQDKIRKEKPLPEVNNNEMPFDLPKGWFWTRLGSISLINPRKDNSLASFVPMSLITTSHTGEHGHEESIWRNIK